MMLLFILGLIIGWFIGHFGADWVKNKFNELVAWVKSKTNSGSNNPPPSAKVSSMKRPKK